MSTSVSRMHIAVTQERTLSAKTLEDHMSVYVRPALLCTVQLAWVSEFFTKKHGMYFGMTLLKNYLDSGRTVHLPAKTIAVLSLCVFTT